MPALSGLVYWLENEENEEELLCAIACIACAMDLQEEFGEQGYRDTHLREATNKKSARVPQSR